jgi:hypothetical protein
VGLLFLYVINGERKVKLSVIVQLCTCACWYRIWTKCHHLLLQQQQLLTRWLLFCIFSAPSDDGLFCVVIHNFWEGAKSFDEDDEY